MTTRRLLHRQEPALSAKAHLNNNIKIFKRIIIYLSRLTTTMLSNIIGFFWTTLLGPFCGILGTIVSTTNEANLLYNFFASLLLFLISLVMTRKDKFWKIWFIIGVFWLATAFWVLYKIDDNKKELLSYTITCEVILFTITGLPLFLLS